MNSRKNLLSIVGGAALLGIVASGCVPSRSINEYDVLGAALRAGAAGNPNLTQQQRAGAYYSGELMSSIGQREHERRIRELPEGVIRNRDGSFSAMGGYELINPRDPNDPRTRRIERNPFPPFFVCNYYIDENRDNLAQPEEFKGVGNNFKSSEKAMLVVTRKNIEYERNYVMEIYGPHGNIVNRMQFDFQQNKRIRYFNWDLNAVRKRTGTGTYNIVIRNDNNLHGSWELRIDD